jgi:toxin YoeB
VNIVWSWNAWEDYVAWQSADPEITKKINALIKEIARDHFSGLGKPEPLKGDLQGFWSRRITAEHRLIYRVAGTGPEKHIDIAQCRFHYRKT